MKEVVVSFLYDIFMRHPNENKITYFTHFKETMSMSIEMGLATIALLIHAILPKYFETTGHDTIERLSMRSLQISPPTYTCPTHDITKL